MSIGTSTSGYIEVKMKNKFQAINTFLVDGKRRYVVWASDNILNWILDYNPEEWIIDGELQDGLVNMSEEMFSILKLKFSDREHPNPYLGRIPI